MHVTRTNVDNSVLESAEMNKMHVIANAQVQYQTIKNAKTSVTSRQATGVCMYGCSRKGDG